MMAVKAEFVLDEHLAASAHYLAVEELSRLSESSEPPPELERAWKEIWRGCAPAGQETREAQHSETGGIADFPMPTLRALDLGRVADALVTMGGLTQRERDVLAVLLLGCTNLEISEETGISLRLVRFHVSNILRKLRISERSQLLRFFF